VARRGWGVSEQVVAEILGRALRDRAFAEQLRDQPDLALAGYDLTREERAAIVQGGQRTAGPDALQDRPGFASRLM
jgi:hypothetical protein